MLNGNKQTATRAFEAIYSRYSTKVYTYCLKVLRNEDIAQDIFQETFVRFLENSDKLKSSSNISGYLITIARNLCLNEKSRKITNNLVQLEEHHLSINEDSYEKKQINELLDSALDSLPVKYKEILVMKEFMDMTYSEIAETIGTTIATVRITIFRAKIKLKDIMIPVINDIEKNSK